ncbi:oxidoreductase [Labrys miyagiensis]|uniref:Oxidoreductase n=1 Tax=Labrys miyagiensis TaxID=346912 RepID=A0ABQ6CMS6_9HYPH|nr:aldo/keto reductase [Labrys miyagiensis]GLS19566.1 oxidoreductase [Labrys miyagiensis]
MSELPAPLKTRPLGRSGFSVSSVAWGMWRFGGEDLATAQKLVETALEAGVTLFDTADIYGPKSHGGFGASETQLGRVFGANLGLRAPMILASKGGIVPGTPYNSSAAYLSSAIDASLRRMNVERIDLWQIHRPDILTHPSEIASALEAAHRAGKIGAIGVSNYTVAQTQALAAFLSLPIVSHQPEFSALHLDPLTEGILDHSIQSDMAVLAWSPLGGGRLAQPQDERSRAVVALFDAKASETGVSRTAAALSWLMAHPSRTIPIVGTQNLDRIREIPQAYVPRWGRAEWYAVLVASRGEKLP